ncbi:MAG: NAD-dependent epimerase/dehydratase family protein [Chitinophagales bacterium]|jgi:dihydroflavonol-4-reductase|nr:NAD(P)-dependent oxidoreductase [Sphingobacteriales bacterium]
MNNKISFVTGANGFVGSHLVEYLLNQGHEVHCLMRKSSDDKWLKGLAVTMHRNGIEDIEFLKEVFSKHKANYIFHLAGTVKAFDYAGFEAGNVKPTRCILEASLGIDSLEKIIVTSSLAASRATRVGRPNDETCERIPLTDYGISKVAEEDLAMSYMDRLPISIIRPPVVYGERDVEVLLFFKTVKAHLIPLIGFTPKSVSLVYVGDLVKGFYQCAISEKSKNQTYFLGGHQDEYTWPYLGELAAKLLNVWAVKMRVPHFVIFIIAFFYEFIANLSRRAVTFNTQKGREMVSESWSCTSQKAKNDFGYNPNMTIEVGFKQTITWYREKGWI